MLDSKKEAAHIKYLIVNEYDLLWGMTINSVGYQKIAPGSHYPTQNHPTRYLFSTEKGRVLDEYQLVYISAGKGFLITNSCKKQPVKEGNMFLLFPGEWHNFMPEKKTGWYEYWIGFKGMNIDCRVNHGFFSKQKPLFNVGLNDKIVDLYMQAVQIAIEQKAGFQQMLAGIVNQMLGLIYSLDKNMVFEDLKVTNKINKAKIIIAENLLTGINVEDLAKKINMSYSWFRKVFKDYTGFAPAQYIQVLKINKGKELLSSTSLSVKEIAFKTGFENPEYFFTVFRKKTGMTALQYRQLKQGSKK